MEAPDAVGGRRRPDRTAAGAGLAGTHEHRHVDADRVLGAELRRRVARAVVENGRGADVLEPDVLEPQLIGVARIDADPDRHVPERRAHHRQAGLVLADGRLALSLEDRIDERVGPERRRVGGEDAVTATEEAQVLADVADLDDPGEPGPDVEVDVAQHAVLRDVEADGDRRRVAVADLEVDVHHRRVERGLVGVGDVVVRRDDAGRREGHPARRAGGAALARPRVREVHHQADAGLEAGRPLRQHEHRAGRAVADDTDATPHEEGARHVVAAGRHEHDAAARVRGGAIQRGLQQRGVVAGSRCRRLDVGRRRVVGTRGEHRGRARGVRHDRQQETDEQTLQHGAVCPMWLMRTKPAKG